MNRRITLSAIVLGTAVAAGAGCGQRLLDFYNDHDDAGTSTSHDLNGVDLNGVDMASTDFAGEDLSGVVQPDMTGTTSIDMDKVDFDKLPDMDPECLALDLPGLGAIVTAGPGTPDYYSPSTIPLTVEAWVYVSTRSAATEVVVAHTGAAGVAASTGYQLSLDTMGHVVFSDEYIAVGVPSLTPASVTSATADTVPLNTWTHIVGEVQPATSALTSPTVVVFLNGVQTGTPASEALATARNQITQPLSIGGVTAATSADPSSFTGYVHDVRISDVARYTTTFTPSVTLSSDADTLALFHFEDPIGSMSLVDSSPHKVNGAPASGAAIGTPPVCQ